MCVCALRRFDQFCIKFILQLTVICYYSLAGKVHLLDFLIPSVYTEEAVIKWMTYECYCDIAMHLSVAVGRVLRRQITLPYFRV